MLLLCLGVTVLLFSQDKFKEAMAPLNPDFLKYQASNSKGGFVPPTYTVSFDNLPKFRDALVLPDAFDLRATGLLSTPRDQGVVGACWSFATMDAIQSVWARMGFNFPVLSVENLANCHGFEQLKNDGGNPGMATAYLSRFNGPVLETSDPFINNPVGTCNTTITAADKIAVVSEALDIPNDVHAIKQMVYRYGGVFTAMSVWQLASATYFNVDSSSVYTESPGAGVEFDHAGTIVGWDDNKVIYNPVGHNPSAPGAWIVKGTFGTGKYDGGYFYVSYEDYFVGSYATVFTKRIEKQQVDTVFSHDKLGHINNFGNGYYDSAWVVVKHTASSPKLITSIATFTSVASAYLDIEVYQDKTGDVLSNLLGEKKNQLCEYPGLHSFDMPINVTGDFYVKIKYKTAGSQMPIPIEVSVPSFATVDVKPVGLQWFKLIATDSLRSVGTATRQFNLCVKVYAQDAPAQPLFTTEKDKYCIADTVVYKNTSVGIFDSYDWHFGEGATPQTAFTTLKTDSFKVVYATEGMKQVKLKTTLLAVEDSIIKGNAIEVLSGVPLSILNSTENDTIFKNNRVTIDVHGANIYQWSSNSYIPDTITDRLSLLMLKNQTDTFRVAASIGQCVANDSLIITVLDKCAQYDDIEDAKTLAVGIPEGPFSNVCATWEINEPYLTNTVSCTSQDGWCPFENRLYHSLWFKFVAPSTDFIKITSTGFDNKIALYDATATGAFTDIISGNPANYTILAANDDSSDTVVSATIQPVKITPGKTYWLQMDGSYGGVTGDAYITITGATSPVYDSKVDLPFIVNPVKNGVLEINNAYKIQQVDILDLSGKTIIKKEVLGDKSIEINVSILQTGAYLVRMITENTIITDKGIIE